MNIDDLCPNECSGNGRCKEKLGCVCNQGFTNNDCSLKLKCKDDCNNNGVCQNAAKCSCFNGWTGMTCNTNIPCPNNCTSTENGICQNNATCKCFYGWSGNDCSESVIIGKEDNLENLEDPFKSLISIKTVMRKDNNTEGDEENDESDFKCENDCSDHGRCDKKKKKCICDVFI